MRPATACRRNPVLAILGLTAVAALAACRQEAPADRVRASGYIEATDVQVAPEVGGRLIELKVGEGDRVKVADVIARLDTTEIDLALRRARAERDQADANVRLLVAGSRGEDIRQAESQVAAAEADLLGAKAELASAEADLERFDTLLKNNSGSEKQRDDAATRRDVARERVRAAEERMRGAKEALARLRSGARREEIDAARARLAVTDAQIATLEQSAAYATVTSPVAGVVTRKLAEVGEIMAPRTPLVIVTDLDHAWANIYVDEPQIPRIRLGQKTMLFTDAGGPGVEGEVTFVSPKAEFTPRNVQTSQERSKLVYRIKVSVDNTNGVFKQGMPVEAEVPLQPPR